MFTFSHLRQARISIHPSIHPSSSSSLEDNLLEIAPFLRRREVIGLR
jgi:hypothetical protein